MPMAFRLPSWTTGKACYFQGKMPYSLCYAMAGRDVDIADAVKFLVSCKAPYNYQENIENLCGAGRSNGQGKGKGRRPAPY